MHVCMHIDYHYKNNCLTFRILLHQQILSKEFSDEAIREKLNSGFCNDSLYAYIHAYIYLIYIYISKNTHAHKRIH